MNTRTLIVPTCLLALALSACDRSATAPAEEGVRKTDFPGQVTAGGGTSGDVVTASERARDASYAGGTPGHAGGMGGNVGGAQMGGTVSESGHGPSGTTQPPAARQTPTGQ